jgi:CRISPR-associated exonuclease Cas4
MNGNDDHELMLSGIQHFAFCPRQWALIHIEQQWADNVHTVIGQHIHERVDDWTADETRSRIRTVRSMPLVSNRLQLRGVADVVEFHRTREEDDQTVQLDGRDGFWKVVPVEYKKGSPKPDDRDEVQLCAQAICLEEMFNVRISSGYLYYAAIKRRDEVPMTEQLRDRVRHMTEQMHRLFAEGRTPPAKYGKHCDSCSLWSVCKPKWSQSGARSAVAYVRELIAEMEE